MVSGSECGCASTFETTGMRGTTISVDARASLIHKHSTADSLSEEPVSPHFTKTFQLKRLKTEGLLSYKEIPHKRFEKGVCL